MVASSAPTAAHAEARKEGVGILIELSGDWRLEAAPPRFADVLDQSSEVRALGFEAGALGAWDSSLLIFLLQARDHCEAGGVRFDTRGLPDRITRLLELARAVPDRVAESDPPPSSRVERLGAAGLAAWDAAMDAVTFTGEVADSVIRLLLRRTRMRWREFWVVAQSNSSGALGIVTLIALLMGVIIAFLGVVVLKRFGAGYYVSYLVGYGMLREMGALMTGIIMAGRTGAAFAAELGSMKITEEIDAYTTLGVSPVDHLVLPRVLGLFVMMPLLVIYADFVGIAGGMMVAVTLLDLTPTQFVGGLLSAVTLSDALLGIFKATIFGLIIGVSGCMKGMQTGSDAGAVGRSATNAVVMGITLIILANAVVDWLAALLQI
ncbi:MAG TPA: ABC transporter permease [Longimicrobiales bacterium]|nr:ABC transporter permease [Longimicrobiales bacterium]